MNKTLKKYYNTLLAHYGPQGWWPGQTRFEVIVGAILTQNTNWTNVEKAIKNLKRAGLLTPAKMHRAKASELSELVRPSGYFNQKTKKLKNFLDHLYKEHGGSIGRLLNRDTSLVRAELLDLNGIGPETADSILLYAGKHNQFVVDAYTIRIISRHGLLDKTASYDETQKFFTDNLPNEEKLFNEYHALIVMAGKDYCRPKKPKCEECPLNKFLDN